MTALRQGDDMQRTNNRIKLNSVDFLMLAMEDVVSSQGQMVTVRFKTRHTPQEMREALRYTLSVFPKLRSVIVPTLFSYRIQLLEDDEPRLGIMFNDAFHVKYALEYESQEYYEYRRAFYNEPFALEAGLPIKMRYLPDTPQPVLFLLIHHMITDGIGCQQVVNAVVAYLNGKRPPRIPIDDPSRSPVYLEQTLSRIPRQIRDSYKTMSMAVQSSKGQRFIHPSSNPVNYFGPVDLHQHTLAYDVLTVKGKATELHCSITVFLIAALCHALSRGRDEQEGNSIGMIMPVDLRQFYAGDKPVFGNYAIAPMLRIPAACWDDPHRLISEVSRQIQERLREIREKNLLLPSIIDKASTLVGKKNYARIIRKLKASGAITKTCTFSNIGNVDHHNEHGPQSQICESISTTNSHGLFIAMSSLGGSFRTSITYQTAEFSREQIVDVMRSFEEAIGLFLSL